MRWPSGAAVASSRWPTIFPRSRLARVLQELASRPFAYDGPDGPRSVTFTVSAGIAESHAGDTVDSVVKRADEGLYQAKKRGRNRVVVQGRSRLASLFRT